MKGAVEDFSSLKADFGLSDLQTKFLALYAEGKGKRTLKDIVGEAGYKFPEKIATSVKDKILSKPGIREWLERHWSTDYKNEVVDPAVAALLSSKGRLKVLAEMAQESINRHDYQDARQSIDMINRMDGSYSIKHEMTGGVAVKVVWGDEDG